MNQKQYVINSVIDPSQLIHDLKLKKESLFSKLQRFIIRKPEKKQLNISDKIDHSPDISTGGFFGKQSKDTNPNAKENIEEQRLFQCITFDFLHHLSGDLLSKRLVLSNNEKNLKLICELSQLARNNQISYISDELINEEFQYLKNREPFNDVSFPEPLSVVYLYDLFTSLLWNENIDFLQAYNIAIEKQTRRTTNTKIEENFKN